MRGPKIEKYEKFHENLTEIASGITRIASVQRKGSSDQNKASTDNEWLNPAWIVIALVNGMGNNETENCGCNNL
jgi:hypothetical protein